MFHIIHRALSVPPLAAVAGLRLGQQPLLGSVVRDARSGLQNQVVANSRHVDQIFWCPEVTSSLPYLAPCGQITLQPRTP